MRLLISGATTTIESLLQDGAIAPYLGALVTPNSSNRLSRICGWGVPYAVDNCCFDAKNFSPSRFLALCERAASAPTKPVFIAVPDVVGNHSATLSRFWEWLPRLNEFDLPLAFVCQDGMTSPGQDVPWDFVDAVFIGGTDDFKDAWTLRIADQARRRKKWSHLGRVNGKRRLRLALFSECDSVDGSSMSRFARTWIPKFVADAKHLEGEAALIDERIAGLQEELARHLGGSRPRKILMVDPLRVTKFDRTEAEIHEFIVFAVCVAGKNSDRIARAVERLRLNLGGFTRRPMLSLLSRLSEPEVKQELHRAGITPHTQKGHALYRIAQAWKNGALDLRRCPVEQLEEIRWVGAKTARFFVLHSRAGERRAVLDTHALRHLRKKGHATPKASPPKGSKAYARLEEAYLKLADEAGMAPCDYDLQVWKEEKSSKTNSQ